MKKIILFALAVLTLAPAHAQFSLNKSGQAVFGKRMSTITLPSLQEPQNPQNVIVGGNLVTIDSLASCVFLGKKSANTGGHITFGGNKHVWIGECATSGSSIAADVMQLGSFIHLT